MLKIVSLCITLIAPSAWCLTCPELARVPVEQTTVVYSDALLWRVVTPGGAQSHIFGTIHLSDPRVTRLPDAVSATLQQSKVFAAELDFDLDVIIAMSQAMYFQGEERLDELIERDLFESLSALLGRYSIPPVLVAKLKPWAAYTTLSLPPGQTSLPLDLQLATMAREFGQEVIGLETLDEQIRVFDRLSITDQLELLRYSVCHHDALQADIEQMIGYYQARDLAAIVALSQQYTFASYDRLSEALLEERNERLTARMMTRLEDGGAFIAIGALHLPGVGGVLDRLRKIGFTIEALY